MHTRHGIRILGFAVACAVIAACAKDTESSGASSNTSEPTVLHGASMTAAVIGLGDPARGKIVFGGNCAVCHGQTGTEGGIGPSLANEKSRKNYAQTIGWIHDPQPPMPKLWPKPLSDTDVADVASYVQRL